ncbi:hypothetical protein KC330_g7889 [Hortaea werneckii]|nr:hypothetical protein KC330_g7889 [Hortaea werneckii]
MTPPPGSQTANGHDLELGSHCLAPFLLCQLLQPVLEATASWHRFSCTAEGCAELKDHLKGPSNSVASTDSGVRIVWVSSFISQAPKGGVQFDERTGAPRLLKVMENYLQSKAGEVLWLRSGIVGSQSRTAPNGFAETHAGSAKDSGVLALPWSPIQHQIFKPVRFGAYSELYAGFSPDIQPSDFIIPFGRRTKLPCHIAKSLETNAKGAGGQRNCTQGIQ